MGWVVMSERDIQRISVLSEIRTGKRSVGSAAAVLSISVRQVRRLLKRLEAGGGAALAYRARGRPNNKIASGIRDYALALIRERYPEFGPTLAAEMLVRHHGLTVSRETLRQWMAGTDLWLARRQRRTFHHPRSRRKTLGELIQIDGAASTAGSRTVASPAQREHPELLRGAGGLT